MHCNFDINILHFFFLMSKSVLPLQRYKHIDPPPKKKKNPKKHLKFILEKHHILRTNSLNSIFNSKFINPDFKIEKLFYIIKKTAKQVLFF